MKRALILLAAVAALAGCAGDDGKDGTVYGYLLGTTGVYSVDFSSIGVNGDASGYIYYNQRYSLISGSHTISWCVGSTSSCTTTSQAVTVEDGTSGKKGETSLVGAGKKGDDGQDRVYYASISSFVLTFTEELVDIGDAPTTLSVQSPASEDGETPQRIPGA